MQTKRKTALIAGASRGLGLAIVAELVGRDWDVIGTFRGGERTELHELAERHSDHIALEELDVMSLASIRALRDRINGKRFDLLLANAGRTNVRVEASMVEVGDADYCSLLLTNALGPIRLLEVLESLVPSGAVLGVMSSILGSLRENAVGAWPAYASSKSALNMLLHYFAAQHSKNRAVIAMAPGWVRTDMGGPSADLSIEESVPRVVDVLTGAAGKPGLRYLNYDGRTVAW